LTRNSVDISRLSKDGRLAPAGYYYDTEAKLVATLFLTDIDAGITDGEARKREEKYGRNVLPEPPPASPLKMLFAQVTDFMVIILLVVAILSFALQDYIEGVVLLLVVITNVLIGFIQEYKAEKALQALKMFSIPTATVIRAGEQETIEAADLVPGDIVVLDEGARIPADLRLFEVCPIFL
jgi:Ca2+-transporting ATPase